MIWTSEQLKKITKKKFEEYLYNKVGQRTLGYSKVREEKIGYDPDENGLQYNTVHIYSIDNEHVGTWFNKTGTIFKS